MQSSKPQPYEGIATRQGYANGYKPKTLASRVGPITFSVPQVRGDTAFYSSALEKGLCSEQALKLAMAEMYVQGVSTRKVSTIVEELCGTAVSFTQVSDCAKFLDAELQKWRALYFVAGKLELPHYGYPLQTSRNQKMRIPQALAQLPPTSTSPDTHNHQCLMAF
jgi:Transposase, Mutator family